MMNGNYVSISVASPIRELQDEEIKSGIIVPHEKQHVTLMFSKETSFDPEHIKKTIEETFPSVISAFIKEYEVFDDLPSKDGSRDAAKGTLVAKVHSPMLEMIHRTLKRSGLSHSYDSFSAHVSVVYGMDLEDAHALKDKLNESNRVKQHTISLSGINSNEIIKNWSTKMNEQEVSFLEILESEEDSLVEESKTISGRVEAFSRLNTYKSVSISDDEYLISVSNREGNVGTIYVKLNGEVHYKNQRGNTVAKEVNAQPVTKRSLENRYIPTLLNKTMSGNLF